jgi:carboxyl-terminal processing protease
MNMENEKNSSALKIMGAIILSVCMLAIGYTAGNLVDINTDNVLDRLVSEKPQLDLFWRVWNVMESEYVNAEEVDSKEQEYGAIKGLVDSYGDPATTFLTPEETETFNSTNEGKYFEGIGAELGYDNGYIIIVTPLEGSPAKEAGIRPRDVILSIDGEPVSKDDNIYEVVDMIRGESGSTVTLEVLHAGDIDSTEIEITRGEITVPSMSVEFIDGIAHIDIARFTDATYLTWVNNWESIKSEVLENGTDKIILDLRSNPGGFFDAAVYVADEFLPGTEIVSIQEDGQGRQEEFRSSKGGDFVGKEVVVLVDAGSASASEILAGALQQQGVAQIVGEQTYGKGTAQSIEDFSDGSSLHVTVFKWLLPDGTWLNRENPITPDLEIELTTDDFTQGKDPQLDKAIEILK